MCLKRLSCTLLLLSLLSASASSQAHSQQSTDLWQNIDNSLNSLEAETSNMKTLIDRQQKQIGGLESAYQEQQQLYLDLGVKYQKSERDMRRWKTCSIVLGTTTVTLGISIVSLIAVMVNK